MHADCVCYVLGCPVKLPRLNEIREKLECLSAKEKQILCDSLFLTINWFREVCFAKYEYEFLPYFIMVIKISEFLHID